MQHAVRFLGYFFALSYGFMLAYIAITEHSLYHEKWHLQYAAASLGLAILVKFVHSGSAQAFLFASMLLPLVNMVLLPSANAGSEAAIAIFNLLFLISYLLVIYQIVQLKKLSSKQKTEQQ